MDSEQRAIRAKQLREDPIFREVMDGLRDAAIKAWAMSRTEEQQEREKAYMMVRAIDAIAIRLQSIEDDQFLSAAAALRTA